MYNSKKTKKFLAGLFFICFSLSLYSQDGGARLYAGPIWMTNRDAIVNPDGLHHTGYQVGADARLMSGGMSFLVGVKYSQMTKYPVDKLTFKPEYSMSTIHGRGGLEFSLLRIGRIVRLRSKLLASLDIVLDRSLEGPDLPPGYEFNDGWMGLLTGLGVDVGPICLDVEYEYGLINGYFQKKNSTFNYLSLTLGFFF